MSVEKPLGDSLSFTIGAACGVMLTALVGSIINAPEREIGRNEAYAEAEKLGLGGWVMQVERNGIEQPKAFGKWEWNKSGKDGKNEP